MSTATDDVTVSFPEDFDAQAEFETAARGYLGDVTVRLRNGRAYQLVFVDPTRLRQTLEDDAERGRAYFTEPGLVVLPEVTREAILQAVHGLERDGYFRHLKPVKGSDQSINAGNIGDVYKHGCLISLFKHLARSQEARTVPERLPNGQESSLGGDLNSDCSELTYVESHGGYALYPSALLRAGRNGAGAWSGDRSWSLGPLLSGQWQSDGVRTLVELVEQKNCYPGSPALALWFLPASATLVFYDQHLAALDSVLQEARACNRLAHTRVHKSDGFEGVRRLLDSAPADPRAGRLAFLDPWYSGDEEKEDWAAVCALLETAQEVGVPVLAWYPKKLRRNPFPPRKDLARLERRGCCRAELWFRHAGQKSPWASQNLAGCGLLWTNLPELSRIAEEVGKDLRRGFAGQSSGKRQLDLEFEMHCGAHEKPGH
jgi:23S rRNA A2030 N6-methylase RlmJ